MLAVQANWVHLVVHYEKDLIEAGVTRFHSGGKISVVQCDIDAAKSMQTEQFLHTRAKDSSAILENLVSCFSVAN